MGTTGKGPAGLIPSEMLGKEKNPYFQNHVPWLERYSEEKQHLTFTYIPYIPIFSNQQRVLVLKLH